MMEHRTRLAVRRSMTYVSITRVTLEWMAPHSEEEKHPVGQCTRLGVALSLDYRFPVTVNCDACHRALEWNKRYRYDSKFVHLLHMMCVEHGLGLTISAMC